MFPNQLYEVVFEEELSTINISVRLYGGALLSKPSLLKPRHITVHYSECTPGYTRDYIWYAAMMLTHFNICLYT